MAVIKHDSERIYMPKS